VSTGGLAVALAEMAVRSGVGSSVSGLPTAAHLFAELPARVVVALDEEAAITVEAEARTKGVLVKRLGIAGGASFAIDGPDGPFIAVSLDHLTATWRDRLPDALGEGTTQA
jgi:phosphoribosylformylglycinamidine (FGAM) synthase-like enzyme